jgi:hypothetical protein
MQDEAEEPPIARVEIEEETDDEICDDAEWIGYVIWLRSALLRRSRYLSRGVYHFGGTSIEDAVQDVLEIIATLPSKNFMMGKTPVEKSSTAITKLAYALLSKMVNTPQKKDSRRRDRSIDFVETDFIAFQGWLQTQTAEHPEYDREFLLALLYEIKSKPLINKIVRVVIASSILPKLPNLRANEHVKLAELLGEDVKDIRNARRQLDTIRNRLLRERETFRKARQAS